MPHVPLESEPELAHGLPAPFLIELERDQVMYRNDKSGTEPRHDNGTGAVGYADPVEPRRDGEKESLPYRGPQSRRPQAHLPRSSQAGERGRSGALRVIEQEFEFWIDVVYRPDEFDQRLPH